MKSCLKFISAAILLTSTLHGMEENFAADSGLDALMDAANDVSSMATHDVGDLGENADVEFIGAGFIIPRGSNSLELDEQEESTSDDEDEGSIYAPSVKRRRIRQQSETERNRQRLVLLCRTAKDSDLKELEGLLQKCPLSSFAKTRQPLKAAVEANNLITAKWLLDHGADPLRRAKTITPLFHAQRMGYTDMIALLETKLPGNQHIARTSPTNYNKMPAQTTNTTAAAAASSSSPSTLLWAQRPGGYKGYADTLFAKPAAKPAAPMGTPSALPVTFAKPLAPTVPSNTTMSAAASKAMAMAQQFAQQFNASLASAAPSSATANAQLNSAGPAVPAAMAAKPSAAVVSPVHIEIPITSKYYFILAAAQGDETKMRQFIQHPANKDQIADIINYSCNSLHLEVLRNQIDTLRCLLAHGADVNATDSLGQTAFTQALYLDHPEIRQLLFEHVLTTHTLSTALTIRDKSGSTPLMIAAHKGDLNLVDILCPEVFSSLVFKI